MEMPPDDFAIGQHDAVGCQFGKRSIIGVLYVSQHPVDGLLLLGIELGNRLSKTQIEDYRIAFLLHRHGIGR